MSLLDVQSVVTSVAALFDDPGQSEIDKDYVLPFINLRWANLVVNLVMLGLQYSEETVSFDVPAGTTTLDSFMVEGGLLASLMQPKRMDWKLVGQPDTLYAPTESTNELVDLDPSSQGILQYSWQGGTVQISPSSVDCTIRLRFQAMSTTLVDPSDQMIRGVVDIISYRVAELIASSRGMPKLKADMKEYGDTAFDDFAAMSVMAMQSQFIRIPATHPRGRQYAGRFVARATAT